MKPIKKIAIIHDLCGVGNVALSAMLPVFAAMKIEACPIPAMLLSTHTGGYGKPAIRQQKGYIKDCARHYKEQGLTFDMIFVGYQGSAEVIEDTFYFLEKNKGVKRVIDPIMGDNGKYYSNFDEEYGKEIKRLLKLGGILLPNYTEACILAGMEYNEETKKEDIEQICKRLFALGAEQIVMTSVPVEEKDQIGIVFGEKETLTFLSFPKYNKLYFGTGDLFAAVLAGNILQGKTMYESVLKAHRFVEVCLKDSLAHSYEAKEGVLFQQNLSHLICEE